VKVQPAIFTDPNNQTRHNTIHREKDGHLTITAIDIRK